MADAAGRSSSLSDLSDDLLRHILSFTAPSDRAKTALLSRRWLKLWRTSGHVYIDSRSFNGGGQCSADEQREAFHRGAEKALAIGAAHGRIRKLTFFIAEHSKITLLKQTYCEQDRSMQKHNLLETLLSKPAARRVEELQVDVKALNARCTLSFWSLPSKFLQVLRLVRCSDLTAPTTPPGATAVFFPMLEDLHLENCSVALVDLQRIVDSAPRLSALVLESCYRSKARFELDVPGLQSFTYRGHLDEHTNLLSLKSPNNMVRVGLHLTHNRNGYYGSGPPPRELFWRFIRNFKSAKVLKLRVDYFTMGELALVDQASRGELLGGLSFSLLEQLDLEVEYIQPAFDTSMVMLADLLHCCPVVRDLSIKFTKHQRFWAESSIDSKAEVQFDKSVSGFRSRRSRSMVSLGRANDDMAPGAMPGLSSEGSFSCLQSHLKRVSLYFFMDEPNCLGVQVAKFFAKNAMGLEELHIDDGSHEMLEHVNSSVRRWIADTDNTNNKLMAKD